MSTATRRHISNYGDRLKAARIASGLLVDRPGLDAVTRQALEDVAMQRDPRVDVVEWVRKIEREGGASNAA